MQRSLRVGFYLVLCGFAVGLMSGSVSALLVGGRAGMHPGTQLFVVTTVGTSLGLGLAILYTGLDFLWCQAAALLSDVRQILRVLRGDLPAPRVNPYESPVWDRELDG